MQIFSERNKTKQKKKFKERLTLTFNTNDTTEFIVGQKHKTYIINDMKPMSIFSLQNFGYFICKEKNRKTTNQQ